MNKPLVICMITNNYTPYSGGVVSSIKSTVKGLRARGHKVIVIALDFLQVYQAEGVENDLIRLPCPIKFRYKDKFIAIPLYARRYIRKILRQYKVDIVHVHHPFLLGVSGLREAKKLNIPVVLTYHTIYEDFLHNVPAPYLLSRPVTRYMVKKFFRNINAIVVPSKSVLSFIENYGCDLPKVEIIQSSILSIFNHTIYNIEEHNKKTNTYLNQNKYNLLTVSRFSAEKNLESLLHAYSYLDSSKFSLTLVGYGPELDKLKELAYTNYGFNEENIRFIIKPDKLSLVGLYNQADLFIFASQTETQGIVLSEALSQSVPVVAFKGTGTVDIVRNGYNGFIVSSASQMAKKIRYIASNSSLLTALKCNAYISSVYYSQEYTSFQLVKLYKSLL